MRLVEPMKSGFQTIAPRSGNKVTSKKGYGSGKETLRFKANGNAAIEDEVGLRIRMLYRLINNSCLYFSMTILRKTASMLLMFYLIHSSGSTTTSWRSKFGT